MGWQLSLRRGVEVTEDGFQRRFDDVILDWPRVYCQSLL